MVEEGVVVEVKGTKATVQLETKPACERCGLCQMAQGTQRLLEAVNGYGARLGDRVRVETQARTVKAGWLLCMVPVALFFAGALLAHWIEKTYLGFDSSGVLSLGAGFLFITVYYVFLRAWDRRHRHIMPTIIGPAQARETC